MIISQIQDGTLIVLSKPFDSRGKYLYLFYFLGFAIPALVLIFGQIRQFDPDGEHKPGLAFMLLMIAGLILIYAGLRFLDAAVQSEKLYLHKDIFTIKTGGILKNKSVSFAVQGISNFRYLKKPDLTDHPLAGKTFDYLGFQTEQIVINEVIGDHCIGFDYDGKVISFGKNISSWEYDDIARHARDFLKADTLSPVQSVKNEMYS